MIAITHRFARWHDTKQHRNCWTARIVRCNTPSLDNGFSGSPIRRIASNPASIVLCSCYDCLTVLLSLHRISARILGTSGKQSALHFSCVAEARFIGRRRHMRDCFHLHLREQSSLHSPPPLAKAQWVHSSYLLPLLDVTKETRICQKTILSFRISILLAVGNQHTL